METYRGYLTLPPEIVDGKPKQRRRYVSGKTRPEVRHALDMLRVELAQGGVVRSRADRTTVARATSKNGSRRFRFARRRSGSIPGS